MVPLLGLSAAFAATPLTALAPGSAFLAVHFGGPGASYPALAADLRSLGTTAARGALVDTLTTLEAAARGPKAHDAQAAAALGAALDLLKGGGTRGALAKRCPALESAPRPHLQEGLFTLSATSYAPVPAALALLRLEPGESDAAAGLLGALRACFGTGTALQQDDVALVSLTIDGVTVTVARVGDVLAAGSTTDQVRAAVRLAHGSSEPSLASRPAGSSPALSGPGFGVAFEGAAVADLLGAVPGLGSDPTADAVRARLQAAMRTVPLMAVHLSAQPDGVLVESWTHVDATGGDPALAWLLRCDGCRARPSLLVPANALSVSASNLRLKAWTDYLSGAIREVTQAGGGELDALSLLKQRTRIDLAGDLFPWLGDVATSVTLPAPAGTPQALLGVPAQITIVPVTSAAQARDGLARLGTALQGLLDQLPASRADTGGVPPNALVATRSATYRDVSITRIQIGPSTDLGVALVGNRLVLASPSAALHTVIDTFRGGPTLHSGPLAAALGAAPAEAMTVEASDPAASLHGAAALLRSASQPVAFAVQSALAGVVQASGDTSTGNGAPTGPDLRSLLSATELPADALDTLAGHLGIARGWSVWQAGAVVGRWFLPVH
ncbi:MAG: hypothetical protein P8Y13_15150 [Deinococcales bacterium]